MTAGSFSEAWRSTSEPRAGTTGRSPGAQARWGMQAGVHGKSAQGLFSLFTSSQQGQAGLTPRAHLLSH